MKWQAISFQLLGIMVPNTTWATLIILFNLWLFKELADTKYSKLIIYILTYSFKILLNASANDFGGLTMIRI